MERVITELTGEQAKYEWDWSWAVAAAGLTYEAKVSQLLRPAAGLTTGQIVVVKLPSIDDSLSFQHKMRLYARVAELTGAEYSSLQQLTGLSCVASVLDWGAQLIDLRAPKSLGGKIEGREEAMTDQFSARLTYRGEQYAPTGYNGKGLFDPTPSISRY